MAESLVQWMVGVLRTLGLPGLALIMALETAGAPVPSEAILLFGGFLAAQDRTTVWAATLAASAGGLVGSAAAYAAGRWGGRPLLERIAPLTGIHGAGLERVEAWFRRRGEWAVFFGRMFPGVRTLVSLPAGVARMPVGRFLWLTFLGSAPWYFALTYLGYALGDRWHLVQPHLRWLDGVLLAALAAAVAAWLWRRSRVR